MNHKNHGLRMNPCCPRCGYDQRGEIERWQEQCPVNGVCSECSLTFEWRDLLSSERYRPAWCIEFELNIKQWPKKSFMTLLHMCHPFGFWTQLQMHHEMHLRRLLVPAFGLLLVAYCMCGFRAANNMLDVWETYSVKRASIKVKTSDRLISTGMSALLPFNDFEFVLVLSGVDSAKYFPSASTYRYLPVSGVDAQFWSRQFGHTVYTDHMPSRWRRWPGFMEDLEVRRNFPPGHTGWMFFDLAVMLTMGPLAFLALPFSRKAAKVMWRHILRIYCYSLLVVPLSIILYLARILWGGRMDEVVWQLGFLGYLNTPLVMLYMVFVFIWWGAAAARLLRMSHATGVGLWCAICSGMIILLLDALAF